MKLDQDTKDPHILEKFKHGAEDQIKWSDTSLFSSGSVVTSTESLRMRIIWPGIRRIDDLGDMMADDQNDGHTGYVSAENNSDADKVFDTKQHLWQAYIQELRLRAADEIWRQGTGTAQSSKSDGTAMPPRLQPYLPSKDCGVFYHALHWQLLGLATRTPGFDEFEETSSISKAGPGPHPTAFSDATAVELPVTPLNLEPQRQAVQDTIMGDFQDTLSVPSYYSVSEGKVTKSTEKSSISMSLMLFLQSVLKVGVEFNSMDWLASRLPFNLIEEVQTDTGKVLEIRKLMEARVDGYLCHKSNPSELSNTNALAIIDAKRYTRPHHHHSIQRHEGAMMACWISHAGDSKTGLLRSSSSGRKRRLMITQYRHEIYIIVGEYGAGFEEHIRPSTCIEPESNEPNSSMGTFSQADSSSAGSDSTPTTPERRNPPLLVGSPAYLRLIQSEGIKVEAQDEFGQPIKWCLGPVESHRTQEHPNLNESDFLFMHEFGPFNITEAGHMELLIKQLIGLMLELRGPQRGFMPEPTDTKFLHQRDPVRTSTPNESSPHTRRTLRKSRSWPSKSEMSAEDGEMLSAKPVWRG